MQGKQRRAHFPVRQIHEENFVKSSFAQHLRRQRGDVVRSRRQEHTALAVLHPRQECGKQPLRQTGVGVAARGGRGKRLFNLVDPQQQRSEFLPPFQRFVQPPPV